ncbi:MAG: hypothetical protein HYZ53_18935 [Planctomycetes bacterium]|nr:hypothetical protein [Planctomycetota bacterium]
MRLTLLTLGLLAALAGAHSRCGARCEAADTVSLSELEVQGDLGSDGRLDVRYRLRFEEHGSRTIIPTLGPLEDGHRMIDVRCVEGGRSVGLLSFPKGDNSYTLRFTRPTEAGRVYDVTLHYVVESSVVVPTRVNGRPYARIAWELPRWDLEVGALAVTLELPLRVSATEDATKALGPERIEALGIVAPATRTDFTHWSFQPSARLEGGLRPVLLKASKQHLPRGAAPQIHLYVPVRHFSIAVPDPPAPAEASEPARPSPREVPLAEQPDLSLPPAPVVPPPTPWIRLAPEEDSGTRGGEADATADAPEGSGLEPTAESPLDAAAQPAGSDVTVLLIEAAAGVVILSLAAWLLFLNPPRPPAVRKTAPPPRPTP